MVTETPGIARATTMLNPDHDNDTANDTKNDTRSKAWGHTPCPAPDDSLGALYGVLYDAYP
ncbi:hypothetical protein, partial [Pseudoalteromonas sp. SIMBA_162]|uniref:hypothetical protein n=1 Tax=Pseudoalteromonas sp. SIMBA_162 TaxID=3080867 RepID=UPI00397BAD3A